MLREFLIEQGATPKAGGIVVNPGVQIRGPYVTPSAAAVSSASILLVEFSRAFGNFCDVLRFHLSSVSSKII